MLTLLLAALQAASLAAAQPPRLVDPQPAITYADYPMEAIRRGEAGIVSVLLQVSADGTVTQCQVTETSLSKLLDAQTCNLLSRRAHFAPAIDANGRAVAGEYRLSTPWGLEKEHQPRTSVDAVLQVPALPKGYDRPAEVQIVFYGAGSPRDCAVLASSGSPAADRTACDYAARTFSIKAPKSGSQGTSVAAVRYVKATLVAGQAN
ncbi:energy transducer TonB [Sphingomonas gei]|nr:energy transducer TonB [Sphingomonas gei]